MINYLGRYTHRVAIANERIMGLENGQISFVYKNYKNGAKKKVLILEAHEFIRRFLLHILPEGFHKIRYYGLLATRNRKTKLNQARKLLGQQPLQKPQKLPWYLILEKVMGINPFQCPKCQKGRMKQVQLILPNQRAPPIAQVSLTS